MNRKLLVGAAVVVAIIAGALIWLNFLRDEGPEEFSLTEDTLEGSAESTTGTGTSDGTSPSSPDDDVLDSVEGTWTVAEGSEAGYRVVEDLQGINDFEAVGRTDQVSGSVTVEGTAVTDASFEIDVASIVSDSDKRDGAFTGSDIMNAAEFPTASFVLTEAADFGSVPAPGEVITAAVVGELTLRDSTQPVEFDIEAQILDGKIELVGSIDVTFADYGIDNPSNPFVAVRDEGTVEVKLLLEQ